MSLADRLHYLAYLYIFWMIWRVIKPNRIDFYSYYIYVATKPRCKVNFINKTVLLFVFDLICICICISSYLSILLWKLYTIERINRTLSPVQASDMYHTLLVCVHAWRVCDIIVGHQWSHGMSVVQYSVVCIVVGFDGLLVFLFYPPLYCLECFLLHSIPSSSNLTIIT